MPDKVLLFDADRKLPNLALMKLSSWHKQKGHEVELNFPLGEYDIVYASCVFTKNWDRLRTLPFKDMFFGGTGTPSDVNLADDVEHIMPDYSLYPKMNYSLGFTSRGCIRKCPWCIVPKKEGEIRPHASIYEFWDHRLQKIVLLDNNLLAACNARETLQDLAKERVLVDFNQGLDIRLINEESAGLLKAVRLGRWLRFSFDEPAMESKVRQGIRILKKAGIPPQRLSFYILIGFDTAFDEDMDRLRIIEDYGCDPFIMAYQEINGVKPKVSWDGPGTIKEFARWVNVKRMHRTLSYERWLRYRKVRESALTYREVQKLWKLSV